MVTKVSTGLTTMRGGSAVERQFLPAALEIIETPPSPLGSALSSLICLFFTAACLWSYLGQIDVVAVATGKTIARSRTQVIQPLEPGAVMAIRVHEGDSVHTGDSLIELDPTGPMAEQERARRDLAQARMDKARLNILLGNAGEETLADVADVYPIDVERARAQFEAQRGEEQAKLLSIEREVAEKTSEFAAASKLLERAQKSLPLIEEKTDIRRKVAEMQFGSRLSYLEAQQQVIEARADLGVQKDHMDGASAAIDGLDRKRAQVEAEFRKSLLADLSHAMAQENAATEALAKATYRRNVQMLRSPIDGTVQQLTVNTVGGVVTPAQQLMVIVPKGDVIDVEAVIPNREIGFVAPGQDVEIKVDAFPFTRYGLLRGKVQAIARDAENEPPHQSPTGSSRLPDQAMNIEAGERLIYTARIAVVGTGIMVDGRPVELLPGMSVKAEIKTGQRRVLDFLLSPLEEYVHDSLRER